MAKANGIIDVLGHDSALKGYTGLGKTWVKLMAK